MASEFSQLAGAHLANIFVIAALACIAIAIFGWAKETIAASAGFRTVSGLAGVLLLFCVYGIYLPRASHVQDAEAGQTAETQTAQTQKSVATGQTKPAQPPAKSTQAAAQASPASARLSSQPQASPSQAPQAQASQPQATPTASQPSAPQASGEDLFSGRWKNADPKAASVLLLRVEERGGEITVRAWGMCLPQHANSGRSADPAPQYCDWGTGHGLVRDGAATISWQQGTVLRRMRLLPDGGSLRVVVDSTYRGHPSQHTEAHFAKSL